MVIHGYICLLVVVNVVAYIYININIITRDQWELGLSNRTDKNDENYQ